MKNIELLAPAGNLEKLKKAVDFGANAVYLGGQKLNLRAFSDNFTREDLIKGIDYAHKSNVKVYVTLNVFPHNDDLPGLEEYLIELNDLRVDALIVSDPGIFMTIKEVLPSMDIHLSTQANNTNWKSALFWHKQGVKRIILARELSLKEIETIRQNLPEDCELEAFIHGSMCMAYSGRCLLSNYMTGRDSNRGECAQPCRYKYFLQEEKRPGQYFQIEEDDKGTYILNSKDLCMIEHIPELLESGITSFKLEGRMKSSYYVAMVVKTYREAIDKYMASKENFVYDENWLYNLEKVSHRQYFTGFYFGEKDSQIYSSSTYIREYDIVGIVKEYDKEVGRYIIEQRNKVFDNDKVEVLSPFKSIFEISLTDMKDIDNNKILSAPRAQMLFTFKSNEELKSGDMLIKSKK
ncbi:MAG TPA: U32 family peptidase [Clostridiaceae bacterium]